MTSDLFIAILLNIICTDFVQILLLAGAIEHPIHLQQAADSKEKIPLYNRMAYSKHGIKMSGEVLHIMFVKFSKSERFNHFIPLVQGTQYTYKS